MSALPPKADIGTQSHDVGFVSKADIDTITETLTSAVQTQRDALSPALFDHLVGEHLHLIGDAQPQRCGGLQIDN